MSNSADLVDHVTRSVSVQSYLKEVVGVDSPGISSTDVRIACPFHKDDTPSLVINLKDGRWNCFGCESSGQSIVGFHQRMMSYDSLEAAARDLFSKFIHPLIPTKLVTKYASNLVGVRSAYAYATANRMVSHETLTRYRIGFGHTVAGQERFTFPVTNSFGLTTNLRLYTPKPKGTSPKMLSYKKGYGRPTELFPFSVLRETARADPIVVCEGEWDALALISIGVPAITGTNGAKSWPKQYNEHFRNRQVVLCFDNDQAGQDATKKVARILTPIVGQLKILDVPKTVGKDVTDWLRSDPKMRQKAKWLSIIAALKPVSENDYTPEGDTLNVKLNNVVLNEHIGRKIELLANVAAITAPSYIVCSHAKITLREKCKAHETDDIKSDREIRVDMGSPAALATLSTTNDAAVRTVLKLAQCCKRCSWTVEPIKYQLVHRIIISPPFDRTDSSRDAAARRNYEAWVVDHMLLPNTTYRVTGRLVADPRNQEATILLTEALPVKSPIESFEMTPEVVKRLMVFRPQRMSVRHIRTSLMRRVDWLIRHKTRIYQRHLMHLVTDLAYHSVPAFYFQKELMPRGMIELLILGDTSTGKGTMINALQRTYALGDVCSGEHASVAGLTCALHQERNRWICEWGKMPLNHRGLLVIDEMQSMTTDDLAKLSRVRSEGVVETNKVIKESAPAMLRLIWVANPRDGRHIHSYGFGIEAVRDLFGAVEDIRRLDLVYVASMSDVPSKIINTLELPNTADVDAYKDESFQELIKWVWSRKPDQVVFSRRASKWILQASERLGKRYSSNIPIIQSENVRFKLAKIAAAIAAMTFSCSQGGHKVSVKLGHARYAEKLINELYSSKAIAYTDLSDSDSVAKGCNDIKLARVFSQLGRDRRYQIVQTLMSQGHITTSILRELIGDGEVARNTVSALFECGALRIGIYHPTMPMYVKTPAFTDYLRRESRKIYERIRENNSVEPAAAN